MKTGLKIAVFGPKFEMQNHIYQGLGHEYLIIMSSFQDSDPGLAALDLVCNIWGFSSLYLIEPALPISVV